MNLLLFCSFALFTSLASSQNQTVRPQQPYCTQATLKADWWSIPPYIYRDRYGEIKGIFKTVLDTIVDHCCNGQTNISYASQPLNDSEVVKDHIGENGTVISFPVYGEMKDTTFQNFPYMPVVEAPGVVFIMTHEDSANAAQAVMDAVFQGWPVLVLTLVMAALSGIIVWALDTYWNPEEFPPSFFQGAWEGFWWAFVSMTTVGYGDRSPRSFFARAFSFVWIMIGLVIISIFTATVTTSLTAISLSNDIKLYGSDVVALKNTEEQRFGVRNNAKVAVRYDVLTMKDAIIKKEGEVIGGLLDSYVAGYWAQNTDNDKKPLADPQLHVGTVFDHQFAYGFVIAGAFEKNEQFETCTRKKLNSMETDITKIIQADAKTMEESGKSAAVEKTQNLFDAESPIFQKAIFFSLGLVGGLTLLGLIWEYAYWRPRQPKAKTTEVEKIITPHTSYEELVAQQSAEIEEIMKNEVQRFYMTWNKKLEDLKYRNSKLRNGKQPEEDRHEVFQEEKRESSDNDAEEREEFCDSVNKDRKKSPFGTSEI